MDEKVDCSSPDVDCDDVGRPVDARLDNLATAEPKQYRVADFDIVDALTPRHAYDSVDFSVPQVPWRKAAISTCEIGPNLVQPTAH
jgi:hypothetical protein